MTALMLIGGLAGGLLFVLVLQLAPPRTGTLVQLGQFYAHYRGAATSPAAGPHTAAVGPRGQDLRTRLGGRVAVLLARRGVGYPGLRADLELTGESFEVLMGRKILAGLGGLVGGLLAVAAIRYGAGVGLPLPAPLVVGLLAGAGLFVVPDVDVRKAARARRAEFLEQLSVFLDLVSLQMAAHAAAAAALPEAAQRGGGWPMLLVRDTLFRARLAGLDPWSALGELGERIGVPELTELAALVGLVAHDGAQVRSTLTARAASMRRARLATEQASAAERDQSMRLAQLLIAVGFMVFVGYPAFVNIKF